MREELLEYIFKHTGEDCLSDLRIPAIFRMHIVFVMKINDDMFPVSEWNQLIAYICKDGIEVWSVDEAKEKLYRWSLGRK